MPEPVTYDHHGVKALVLQKNFGGLYPMVDTWAAESSGPLRTAIAQQSLQKIEQVT